MLRRSAAALGAVMLLLIAGCSGSSTSEPQQLVHRKNIKELTAQEKKDFVEALLG